MRLRRLFSSTRSPACRAVLISAYVLGAATAVVVAEQATVQRPVAEILDAKGAAGDVIETVRKDAKLEVIGPHEGVWLHVRTPGGKVGYVPASITQNSGGGPDLSGIAGSSTATPTLAPAAGRGLDPEVENYIAAKRLDPAALMRMQARREACRGKVLRDFEQKGKVGSK
jgi:hypothetical protein